MHSGKQIFGNHAMVAIQLKPDAEERLQAIASAEGQTVKQVAERILEDYLALQNLPDATDADWAQSAARA